jgi:DNA-binding winged helix-turn-helix (wHTH) protein
MSEQLALHFPQSDEQVLIEGEIIAGVSKKNCNLFLRDHLIGRLTTISRKHFKIYQTEEDLVIEDLGGKNGTEVNGEPLLPREKRIIHEKDVIRLAKNNNFKIRVVPYGTTVIEDDEIETAKLGVYFDKEKSLFYVDGEPIHRLTPILYDLLKYLYDNKEEPCSHYDIIQNVRHGIAGADLIRSMVARLRRELEKTSLGARGYIKTIPRYGYKLTQEKSGPTGPTSFHGHDLKI